MITSNRSRVRSKSHGGQSRQRAPAVRRFAGLICAVVLAALAALTLAGCGHHFHVTFHAGEQTGSHVSRATTR